MSGTLPGGAEGAIALYTYEDTDRDSDGNSQTTYVNFTVVISDIPESAPHVRELYCQRRVGFRFLDSAEDVFRTRKRIELESVELDERCEIFAGRDQDPNFAATALRAELRLLARRRGARRDRLRARGRNALRQRQGPPRQRRRARPDV